MKNLRIVPHLVTLFILLSVATVLAVPGERIDPKSVKHKVSFTLGAKGTIQFKQRGDLLTEPKLSNKFEEGGGVGGEFRKNDKDDRLIGLMVQNRFPKALRYRALMRLKGRKEYVETSIVPVMAGLLSYESWADPIEELILFDFRLTDEKP